MIRRHQTHGVHRIHIRLVHGAQRQRRAAQVVVLLRVRVERRELQIQQTPKREHEEERRERMRRGVVHAVARDVLLRRARPMRVRPVVDRRHEHVAQLVGLDRAEEVRGVPDERVAHLQRELLRREKPLEQLEPADVRPPARREREQVRELLDLDEHGR